MCWHIYSGHWSGGSLAPLHWHWGFLVLQAIAHDIYTDLVEDACLGLCFEVHRAVKCGYFFLDDTDPDSMKDFGEFPLGPKAAELYLKVV